MEIIDFWYREIRLGIGQPKIERIKSYEICTEDTQTNKWYFVAKIFLTVRKNCSSNRDKLLKFEAEGQEFATRTIHSNSERSEQNAFLTCFLRFLISNRLNRTIRIQIGKKYWYLETCKKSQKNTLFCKID